jgi:hypothetical protein
MEMQFMGTGSIYGTSQFAITCVIFSSHIKQKVKKKICAITEKNMIWNIWWSKGR